MRYCTLFDHHYAPQGLTLIASMIRHCRPFNLDVLALTDETAEMVRKTWPSVTVHSIADVESYTKRPISQMAVSMKWKHFCWAMNSILCEYVQNTFRESVFSLDADTFFFASPEGILDQLTGYAAAAPPHNFPPYLEHTVAQRGKYNVGGVYFSNDALGYRLCKWWADRVCEQCDDHNCGDQLYWDTIADMAGKRFLELPVGFNAAPWMRQYHFHRRNGIPCMTHKLTTQEHSLIHFHFHEFCVGGGFDTVSDNGTITTSYRNARRFTWQSPETGKVYGLTNYEVGRDLLGTVYAPYVQLIEEMDKLIEAQK